MKSKYYSEGKFQITPAERRAKIAYVPSKQQFSKCTR